MIYYNKFSYIKWLYKNKQSIATNCTERSISPFLDHHSKATGQFQLYKCFETSYRETINSCNNTIIASNSTRFWDAYLINFIVACFFFSFKNPTKNLHLSCSTFLPSATAE